MDKIVKYNNRLNTITFKNFLASDCNFFMFICYKLKNKKECTIQVTFQEIRDAVNLRKESNIELEEALLSLNDKLLATTGRIKDGGVTRQFTLFNEFITDVDNQLLTVSVNEKYAYILNYFKEGFYTKFEFQEFMLLTSKHSKTLYRLLKQFRTTGKYMVYTDDLKKYMDCSNMETRYFTRDVIKKAMKELQEKECFQDLALTTTRSNNHGGTIKTFTFTFKPEVDNKEQEVDNNEIQETKNDAPDKMYKTIKPSQSKPNPSNKFNNFTQRVYDYADLERKLILQ